MSTMREVAAMAGVSGKTVSRVINGDRYVSADVRSRVERAVTQLQYVPNMLSQSFRSGHDNAIGIAVPEIADPFFGAVVQAVERTARARRSAVIITSLGDGADDERAAVEALLRRQVTGLIIAPVSTEQSYMLPWQRTTVIVFIDRPPSGITADSVVEDDFGGAVVAIRHLIDQGHHRIAFLGNGAAVVTTGRRLEGYRAALTSAGISPDGRLIRLYQEGPGRSVTAVRELLALPDPPTAIFSSNSEGSVPAVAELHACGRNDLAFVSFGDFPMAAALRPSVTVLDQDPGLVGRTAATRLFDRIDCPTGEFERQIVLPVQLRIRDSTPAPLSPAL